MDNKDILEGEIYTRKLAQIIVLETHSK